MKNLLLLFDGIHLEGGVPMAIFYAVFGFVFVFVGIVLLILLLAGLGLLMKRINARREKKTPAPAAPPRPVAEEGIPPEVVAAITAAIAAYTEGEASKCDFVVRRIRKV